MPSTLEMLRVLTRSRMTKRITSTIPLALQNDMPGCAQDCLATSIEQTFLSSACSNATDLACLCSTYNSQGLTLGEASLVCLSADCPQSYLNSSSNANAYGVCSGQSNAVAPTHSVLTSFETATTKGKTTAASLSASQTAAISSIESQASVLASPHVFSVTLSSSVTSLHSVTSSKATTISTETTSPVNTGGLPSSSSYTNMTAASTTRPGQSSSLTSGQAVGVSLGAFGGLGVLIALIFCCICTRRKKQKKLKQRKPHDSFDFVDKSPGPDSTFPYHHYNFSSQRQVAAQPHRPEPAKHELDVPAERSQEPTAPGLHLDGGRAYTNRPITQWPKPTFPASRPAKPGNWKPPRPPRPDSNATALTVFEEDGRLSRIRDLPEIPSSPFVPYKALHRQSIGPSFVKQYTLSPEDMYHPSLSLEIPPMSEGQIHGGPLPSPTDFSPSLVGLRSGRLSGHMSMPPNSAMSYLPAYYTSNDSRTPVVPSRSPNRLSYPCPVPKLPTKSAHMSYASDTTFDSIDPDEVTPPDEADKRLSAVAESPLSGLRYPKIPRPSNQAIPRSPPQSRWTASTTAFSPSSDEQQPTSRMTFSPASDEKHPITLLSKRRGEGTAQDLEQRLHLGSSDGPSSVYSQTSTVHGLRIDGAGSPSRGRKDPRSNTYETPEMALKSPLWEPELTPSKRGDDLFISVH